MKTVSVCNRKNLTNTNTQKPKKAQRELTRAYIREQTEYIQNQINKIRNSVEDKYSCIASQTVNEVIKRKSRSRAKLKAVSQERMRMRK